MSAAKVENEHSHTAGVNDTVQDDSVHVADERNRSYELFFAFSELAIIVLFVTCTTFGHEQMTQVSGHEEQYDFKQE
jgi:hypothetical protein